MGGDYKTLVIGVGNTILCDEGVGVRVAERLVSGFRLPEKVYVLDGGTLGLDLLFYLEGVENLLIIDAVEAGLPPGSLLRLEGEDVPAFLSMKISPHQIGIPDMLFAAKLKDLYPRNVVLLGIQPARLELGVELSDEVGSKMDSIIEQVLAQLNDWGIEVEKLH